jgi:hypothetical protein
MAEFDPLRFFVISQGEEKSTFTRVDASFRFFCCHYQQDKVAPEETITLRELQRFILVAQVMSDQFKVELSVFAGGDIREISLSRNENRWVVMMNS